MDKNNLIKLIDENLSIRDISEKTEKSYSSIRYWLKKFNLKTNYLDIKNENKLDINKKCPKCNENKNKKEFYKRSSGKRMNELGGYCKDCSNKYHTLRVRNVKIKMIRYKGSECENCKLSLDDSNYYVFDFHHIDPMKKDPNFNRIKYQKWEKIKSEIDKCKLLCSNCHRTEHYNLKIGI